MDKIETIPMEFIENIWDAELPEAIRKTFQKVEQFVHDHNVARSVCPKQGCNGSLNHVASQDRAADEGMNIRFICSVCKHTVR